MESLVDLLPLLFIGLYYLLAGRRRAQQKRAQQSRATAPREDPATGRDRTARDRTGRERGETPFQSFLGQLEEAMAEAAGEPLPSDPPERSPSNGETSLPPTPLDPTVPLVEVTDAEFRPASGSFDSPAPVDHVRHGFGPGNPQSEESFERAPAFSEPARAPVGDYDPHGLRPRPGPRASGSSRSAAGWRRRLSDPKAAQDAFVLQTVFGARGGRRAERRR